MSALSTHRQTYGVAGMTCGHCVAAVTQEVGAIAGSSPEVPIGGFEARRWRSSHLNHRRDGAPR